MSVMSISAASAVSTVSANYNFPSTTTALVIVETRQLANLEKFAVCDGAA
jgi:hypothetical protein